MNTVSTINESLPDTERPAFAENEIIPILKEQYDLCCTAKELPGERDRNYLVQDKIGNLYVLKISNASESLDYLETQNQALECTAKFFDHGRIPRIIPDIKKRPTYIVVNEPGTYKFSYENTPTNYITGSFVASNGGPIRLDINPTAWATTGAAGSVGDITFVYVRVG